MSSNGVNVRLLERSEYVESLTVRGRGTKNTLTANSIFLPQRGLHTAQESYKRFAHSVPKVQITRMLPTGNGPQGTLLSIGLTAGRTLRRLRLFLALRVG